MTVADRIHQCGFGVKVLEDVGGRHSQIVSDLRNRRASDAALTKQRFRCHQNVLPCFFCFLSWSAQTLVLSKSLGWKPGLVSEIGLQVLPHPVKNAGAGIVKR